MIHVWTVSFFFFSCFFFLSFFLLLPSHTNVYRRSQLKTDKADSKRHLIIEKSAAAPHLTAVNNYRNCLSFSASLAGEGSHAANSQRRAVMWFVWFPLNASCPVSFLIFNCFDGSSETTPFPIRKYRPLLPFLYWYFSLNILRVLRVLGFFLVFLGVYFSVLRMLSKHLAHFKQAAASFKRKIYVLDLSDIHHKWPQLQKAHKSQAWVRVWRSRIELHFVVEMMVADTVAAASLKATWGNFYES